jgi:hypothetical protein
MSRSTIASVTAWAALVAAGIVAGGHLASRHGGYHVDAAPFVGRWAVSAGWSAAPLVAFGVTAVVAAPRLADRLSWRRLLLVAFAAAVAWTILLAASEGLDAVARPARSPAGYLAGVPLVESPARFLRTFTADWMRYPTHVKAHPPGLVVALWVVDRLGLGGAWWAAAIEVAGGALAVPAVLVAVRELSSEAAARRAAPFVALAPAALWATSGDAVFAGVTAWAVAAVVVATGRRGSTSHRLAAAGGAAWAGALLLTYGVVPLGVIPAAVAWSRHRLDVLLVAGVVTGAALALVALTGFWWPAGLAATHRAYLAGVAPSRPFSVFVWLNLAAFAAAVGPVAVPALVRLRDRGVWLLAGGALLALAAADLSGLSKGEVERIWLPWVPWLLVAAVAVPASLRARRQWLGGQVAFATALQIVLRSSW